MTITVQDVLRLVHPFGARLEAGRSGLGRCVSWVHSSDLPDIGGWLRGGEVILNTALHIPDPSAAEALTRSLSQGKAAAVIFADDPLLQEPQRRSIRSVADRLQLPVILIPVPVKFVDVTQAISKAIISQQLEKLQYWETVHDRFIRSALEGKGVTQVVALLAEMIRRDVALVDSSLRVISSASGTGGPHGGLAGAQIESLERSLETQGVWNRLLKPEPALRKVAEIDSWVRQIRARGELLGLLLVIGDETMTDRHLIALDQAAMALALELLKERELRDLDGRLGFELVGDILSGKLKDFGEAHRRAAFLGYDLAGPYQILLIEELPPESAPSRPTWTGSRRYKQRYFRAVDWALGATPLKMLVMARSDSLVLVVFDLAESDLMKRFGMSLISKLEQDSRGKYAGGISLLHSGAAEIQEGVEEARRALRTAIRIHGHASVTSIEELGVKELILGLAEKELARFCKRSLDSLSRSSQAPELIKTVQSYLETEGSLSRTASRLGIHRNTVLQRLHRFKEMTGLDPQRVSDWLSLSVLVAADGLRRNGSSGALGQS